MTNVFFIFGFLPIALIVYYFMGKKVRPYIMALFSLLFYVCGSPQFFLLLLLIIFINFVCGHVLGFCKTQRKAVRRFFLICGIGMNASVLLYYKYAKLLGNVLGDATYLNELILPLGLSFFCFKAISYLVDIYRGTIVVNKNPIHLVNYLSFFGQIESGPLSRYTDMERDNGVEKRYLCLVDDVLPGMERFAVGFIKKTLLSNVLYNIVEEVFSTSSAMTSSTLLWLGAICYSLQLFFDFSGYSDMAIGVSRMFGMKCPENFNYPYATKSVAEFWRRWHITLGAWFRDYVYIPMGGSRCSKPKIYFNLLVVWLLTGVWHGANWTFIVWGLSNFAFIAIEKAVSLPDKLNRWQSFLYRIFVLLVINFEWVIFRSKSISDSLIYIKGMLVSAGYTAATSRALFLIKDYFVFILVAVLLAFPIVPRLKGIISGKKVLSVCCSVVSAAVIMLLFMWSISFIVAGANNPFVYANF